MPGRFLIDDNGHVRYLIPGDPGWDDNKLLY